MALREFTDGTGSTWQAWETRPTSRMLRREFLDGWLTFEQGPHRRRLAPIPAGWAELPEPALRQLCAEATPEPRRPRLIE